MELLSNLNKIEPKILHSVGDKHFVDYNGQCCIQQPEVIICLPYLIEQNAILLRYEMISAFQIVKPEIDKYLTVLSDNILSEESPVEALTRMLLDKFGLQLSKQNIDILPAIFLSKDNTTRYHICILPLMEHEYNQLVPSEVDQLEMKDSNVLLNISQLPNVIIYDLITRYALDIFKQHYSLL